MRSARNIEADPRPGDLRHMVEIGRTVHEIGENGYTDASDETVCRVWAALTDDSSRYFTATDAENAERGMVFIIRWREDVKPGMWVLFRDEKRWITQIGEYDFQRRYLKLTTRSVKGVK